MFVVVCCALVLASAHAIDDPPKNFQMQIPDEASKQITEQQSKEQSMSAFTISLFIFGSAILLFTALLVAGIGYTMLRVGKDLSDPSYQRMLCVTLVLGLGAFLVVAGYSASQMAGLFGIMGSIVGYLFGERSKGEEHTKQTSQADGAPQK